MTKRFNYWEKFEENKSYHIYNRGNNKENIFITRENYHYFFRNCKRLIFPFFDIFSYCLMPNHFHFLMRVRPLSPGILEIAGAQKTVRSQKFLCNEISYNEFLEDQFKRLFQSYAQAFNKQQNRTGSLFQKRFKRVGVQNEAKLMRLLAYIHHNPIHHKYREDYGDWRFSSFRDFLFRNRAPVQKLEVLNWFSDHPDQATRDFLKFHEDFKWDRQYLRECLEERWG